MHGIQGYKTIISVLKQNVSPECVFKISTSSSQKIVRCTMKSLVQFRDKIPVLYYDLWWCGLSSSMGKSEWMRISTAISDLFQSTGTAN